MIWLSFMLAVNLPSPSSVQALDLAHAMYDVILGCSQRNISVWYLESNAFFPTLMFLDICMFAFVFNNSWWLYMRWCVTADVFLVDWRENWWSANGWSRNESCHKCAPWLIRVIWSSGEGRTSTGFVLYHF